MSQLVEAKPKRRTSGERIKAARARRKREMLPKHHRSIANKMADKKRSKAMKRGNLAGKIAAMASTMQEPANLAGSLKHPTEYVTIVIEATAQMTKDTDMDPREFAKHFLDKDPQETNTPTGMAAILFEAFLIQNEEGLYSQLLETYIEPGDKTFLAIFEGPIVRDRLARLVESVSAFLDTKVLVRYGQRGEHEVSDLTILECAPLKEGIAAMGQEYQSRGGQGLKDQPKFDKGNMHHHSTPSRQPIGPFEALVPKSVADYEKILEEGPVRAEIIEGMFGSNLTVAQREGALFFTDPLTARWCSEDQGRTWRLYVIPTDDTIATIREDVQVAADAFVSESDLDEAKPVTPAQIHLGEFVDEARTEKQVAQAMKAKGYTVALVDPKGRYDTLFAKTPSAAAKLAREDFPNAKIMPIDLYIKGLKESVDEIPTVEDGTVLDTALTALQQAGIPVLAQPRPDASQVIGHQFSQELGEASPESRHLPCEQGRRDGTGRSVLEAAPVEPSQDKALQTLVEQGVLEGRGGAYLLQGVFEGDTLSSESPDNVSEQGLPRLRFIRVKQPDGTIKQRALREGEDPLDEASGRPVYAIKGARVRLHPDEAKKWRKRGENPPTKGGTITKSELIRGNTVVQVKWDDGGKSSELASNLVRESLDEARDPVRVWLPDQTRAIRVDRADPAVQRILRTLKKDGDTYTAGRRSDQQALAAKELPESVDESWWQATVGAGRIFFEAPKPSDALLTAMQFGEQVGLRGRALHRITPTRLPREPEVQGQPVSGSPPGVHYVPDPGVYVEESVTEARLKAKTVPDKHAERIALKTLKMPAAMIGVMGGPTRAEAIARLKRLGYTNAEIKRLSEGTFDEAYARSWESGLQRAVANAKYFNRPYVIFRDTGGNTQVERAPGPAKANRTVVYPDGTRAKAPAGKPIPKAGTMPWRQTPAESLDEDDESAEFYAENTEIRRPYPTKGYRVVSDSEFRARMETDGAIADTPEEAEDGTISTEYHVYLDQAGEYALCGQIVDAPEQTEYRIFGQDPYTESLDEAEGPWWSGLKRFKSIPVKDAHPDVKRIHRAVGGRKKSFLYGGKYYAGQPITTGWSDGSRKEWSYVTTTGKVKSIPMSIDPNRMGDPFKQRKVLGPWPSDALAVVSGGTFRGKPAYLTLYSNPTATEDRIFGQDPDRMYEGADTVSMDEGEAEVRKLDKQVNALWRKLDAMKGQEKTPAYRKVLDQLRILTKQRLKAAGIVVRRVSTGPAETTDEARPIEPALPKTAKRVGKVGPNEKWTDGTWDYLVDPRDTSVDRRGRVLNVVRAGGKPSKGRYEALPEAVDEAERKAQIQQATQAWRVRVQFGSPAIATAATKRMQAAVAKSRFLQGVKRVGTAVILTIQGSTITDAKRAQALARDLLDAQGIGFEDTVESVDEQELWVKGVKTKWTPPEGLFKGSPKEIAAGVSKGVSLKTALARLSFYTNRAGANLPPDRLAALEKAKQLVQKRFESEDALTEE